MITMWQASGDAERGCQVQNNPAPKAPSPLTLSRVSPTVAPHHAPVRSSLVVASQRPSGAIASAVTASVWPVRVWRVCPMVGSQIRTVRSSLVVASQRQSGAIDSADSA